jgi:acetylornithine deacetylase/succinyl-diaminopimelate desuccinylase-like protein
MTQASSTEAVLAGIDREEIVELALGLANIDSPSPRETEVCEYLAAWLDRNDFPVRRIGLTEDRPNLMSTISGTGTGRSLLFNSHLDTSIWPGDRRLRNPGDRIYHSGWREGEVLCGHGVMNDKGPLAAWLIACRAIRASGVRLAGDLVLTAVVGETGSEPVDEYQGSEYFGKDAGARHLAVHGGVADYVLVAEATAFQIGWVEAGKAFCKVTIFGGTSVYTPYVKDGDDTSALMRTTRFLNAWDAWAASYTRRHRREFGGGIVEPRASIGAIRSGLPYNITRTPETCELYLDLRTAPGQSPTDTVREVRDLLADLQLDGDVELFLHRPGYEAKGVEPLIEAIHNAHANIFGGAKPLIAGGPTTSMWRDINVWNELGIPAAMYGPGGGTGGGSRTLTIHDLHQAAQVYALTAIGIAG